MDSDELPALAGRARARAAELAGNGEVAEAVEELAGAIAVTLDHPDTEVASIGRAMLLDTASLLMSAGEHDEALRCYDRIAESADREQEPLRTRLKTTAWARKGDRLGELLRYDEAREAFAAVAAHAADPDPETRERVARSLFNTAVATRELGRADEALAAFDAVTEFAGEDRSLDRWAALAVYNKAGLLVTLDRVGEALDGFARTRRFADSESAEAVERAARAARRCGDELVGLGRADDADRAYREAAEAFARSPVAPARVEALTALLHLASAQANDQRPDAAFETLEAVPRLFPGEHDFAAAADELRAELEAQLTVVPHAEADPVVRSRYNEVRERIARHLVALLGVIVVAVLGLVAALVFLSSARFPVAGAVVVAATGYWWWAKRRVQVLSEVSRGIREQFESEAQAQTEDDEAARKVRSANAVTGQPFALFLRSFELEGARHLVDRPDRPEWVSFHKPGLTAVEKSVVDGLGRYLPVIGVANPSDNHRRFKTGGVPKLVLPNDGWEEVVRELVVRADLIVFQPTDLSPGVSTELSIIVEETRQFDTVVVLSEEAVQETDLVRAVLSLSGVEAPSHQRLSAASREFGTFQRIVDADGLDFTALGGHPAFADLLEHVEFVNALEPRARRQATDARLRHLEAGRDPEPAAFLRVLNEAAETQRRLGDRLGLIRTLLMIAVVRGSWGDGRGALGVAEEALGLCRASEQVLTGPLRHVLGGIQADLGDDRAIETLHEAAEDVAAAGSRDELASIWRALADLCFEAGDVAPGLDLLDRAAVLQRALGDHAGLVATLTNRAAAQLAVDAAEAAATAREGLELVRAHAEDWEPVLLLLLALALRDSDPAEAQRQFDAAQALPITERHTGNVEALRTAWTG